MPQTLADWLQACSLPKSEARMLLQHAGGYTRARQITCAEDILPESVLASLNHLAERRLRGEPMAYLLGEREFYGRMFAVNPNVLIPRPETEHLVEAVLRHLPQNGKVWDMGTGSGIIAVTIALERPDVFVRASDISPAALDTAKANAAKLGAEVEFACGSWFDVDRPSEQHGYDVIVSNPPYIEAEDDHLRQGDLRFEPQNALTDFSDGLSAFRVLAEKAGVYLKAGGWLMVEHGYNQGDAVRYLFSDNGFAEVVTLPDLAGLERLTIGRLKEIKS
ncbi:peptide chain release factor N(5)-glutamine methyltransferase [Neisseria montereyensis]|uniref:Release factor glutamine methyltransferase n=1 Tax=Neisseria montereyensis TaxID=2973938 RepID=A0ABT2FD60_9NEIS|nr:peptide chain release factor N(5)-glutamine methyltransferase [Neisseria montereyensis]MCS4534082.1 peptide chain release factor N(5)-glutamine methyltransferase [Neisseria montereyensis]